MTDRLGCPRPRGGGGPGGVVFVSNRTVERKYACQGRYNNLRCQGSLAGAHGVHSMTLVPAQWCSFTCMNVCTPNNAVTIEEYRHRHMCGTLNADQIS